MTQILVDQGGIEPPDNFLAKEIRNPIALAHFWWTGAELNRFRHWASTNRSTGELHSPYWCPAPESNREKSCVLSAAHMPNSASRAYLNRYFFVKYYFSAI